MSVILLALGRVLGSGGTRISIPAELIPVAGRPLIQRIVEALADSGKRNIGIVLKDDPERFSSFLGDGERWGVEIAYHRCPPGGEPFAYAASLGDEAVDPLVPVAVTGFPGALDLSSYLEAVCAAIGGRVKSFVPSGRETSPGIRVSHHARIHPSARLTAPLYVGEGVEIGADAVVGPFVSLERGAVVARGTMVRRSVLLPWTMVGEGLSLEDVVVEGAAIFKPGMDAAYVAEDPALSASRRR